MDDLIGKKFNKLTLVKFLRRNDKSHPIWLMICDYFMWEKTDD